MTSRAMSNFDELAMLFKLRKSGLDKDEVIASGNGTVAGTP